MEYQFAVVGSRLTLDAVLQPSDADALGVEMSGLRARRVLGTGAPANGPLIPGWAGAWTSGYVKIHPAGYDTQFIVARLRLVRCTQGSWDRLVRCTRRVYPCFDVELQPGRDGSFAPRRI